MQQNYYQHLFKHIKSCFAFIAVYMLFFSTQNTFAQTFSVKTSVPGTGSDYLSAVSFTIGSKIYVGGGFYSKAMHEYNAATDQWVSKKDIPNVTYSRAYGCGFSINGKGYVLAGRDINPSTFMGTAKNDLWEYDPGSNNWTQKTSYPGLPFTGAAVFVISNRAYVVGGVDSSGARNNKLYVYDPATNAWTQKANYPEMNIVAASAFTIGTKGYVACGDIKTGSTVNATNKLYEYNPATDAWTAKAAFPGTARSSGTAFVVNSKGYVGLGSTVAGPVSYTYYTDFFAYDAAANTWGSAINFPYNGRQYAVAGTVGSNTYLGAGWTFINGTNAYYKDWLLYGTAGGAVSNTGITDHVVAYPNPTGRVLNVYYPADYGEGAYSIYNVLGQAVRSGTITPFMSIDMDGLAVGQYVLSITVDEGTGRVKFYRQ